MKNLQEATERICELKGSLIALDALVPALIGALSHAGQSRLTETFDAHSEAARTVLLNGDVSDLVLEAFERDVLRNRNLLQSMASAVVPSTPQARIDDLLLATTSIKTSATNGPSTNASGFFFRRRGKLFLVSSRHVFIDIASSHFPDRIEIGLHIDRQDLTQYSVISLPLYVQGMARWREASDSAGTVDIGAIQIMDTDLPVDTVIEAFEPRHLQVCEQEVAIGDALTIVGYPLGFHDTIHHLAVARTATVASAYGVRFQQQGYFLTDARMHRGSSGSPVVRRQPCSSPASSSLPWQLLGVHSTRMDMGSRDEKLDESLGLNCAWYADVLETITADV